MKSLNDRKEEPVKDGITLPECPDCESTDAVLEHRQQVFSYGKGKDAAELTCEVPVYRCNHCGCEWTGSEAEDARQRAVCRYLGRLTPDEVRGVREAVGLSQAEFSRITGLGEASLSRWETGAQVQNTASDRLLRLLQADRQNLRRLEQIADDGQIQADHRVRVVQITPELRNRQKSFQLRRAS
jgi:putative zinc finger/helix-turn-helix YgiT family protein